MLQLSNIKHKKEKVQIQSSQTFGDKLTNRFYLLINHLNIKINQSNKVNCQHRGVLSKFVVPILSHNKLSCISTK